ncbi:MAG: hypothetical protein U9P71_02945 [Campylobacterota bacterium]|nr:hypothetical protein [Campylobacterota bacterium]
MDTTYIKAHHEMEERYARLVFEYFTNNQRKEICDSVANAIELLDIAPSLTVTPTKNQAGEYSIEFHDDYDKESHKFFESLIKDLKINRCDVD